MFKRLMDYIKLQSKIKELQPRIANLNLCYLTGAGISAASGIRPFRGKEGIYSETPDLIYKLRPDSFETDPQFLYDFHETFRQNLADKVPNEIHSLIAQTGKYVITQNIDDLHEKSGAENIIHVHGEVQKYRCRSCDLVQAGEFKIDGKCKVCQSENMLRHHVVLFKESIINQREALAAMKNSQVLISIGTSGTVFPVGLYPQMFEGIRICINEAVPENAHMFDAVLIGDSKKILKDLLKLKLP